MDTTLAAPAVIRHNALNALAHYYDQVNAPNSENKHVRIYREGDEFKVGNFSKWELVLDLIRQLLEVFGVTNKGISGDGKINLQNRLVLVWNNATEIPLPKENKETIFKATLVLKRLGEHPKTAEIFSEFAANVERSVVGTFGEEYVRFADNTSELASDREPSRVRNSQAPALLQASPTPTPSGTTSLEGDLVIVPVPVLGIVITAATPSSTPEPTPTINPGEIVRNVARPAPSLPSVPYTLLKLLGLQAFGDTRQSLSSLTSDSHAILNAQRSLSSIETVLQRKESNLAEQAKLQQEIGSTAEEQEARLLELTTAVRGLSDKIAGLEKNIEDLSIECEDSTMESKVRSTKKQLIEKDRKELEKTKKLLTQKQEARLEFQKNRARFDVIAKELNILSNYNVTEEQFNILKLNIDKLDAWEKTKGFHVLKGILNEDKRRETIFDCMMSMKLFPKQLVKKVETLLAIR